MQPRQKLEGVLVRWIVMYDFNTILNQLWIAQALVVKSKLTWRTFSDMLE